MKIEYGNERLRRLAEDPEFQPKQWGRDLVFAYRKKVQVLDAARDERDLRAMRSLNLQELEGDLAGQYSIRLNRQLRLILAFRIGDKGKVVVIRELVDYQ